MKLKYIVTSNKYKNINEIMKNEFNFSTRLSLKLIKGNMIFNNGFLVDSRNLVNIGDVIVIDLSGKEDNFNIVPTKMILDIVYEDSWILVVNKPPKIAIHPSRGHFDNSLSNGVKYYFDSIHLSKKIRPVNRLDLDTSGLVIFAKCEYIQEAFSIQMKNNTFKKSYLCFVDGLLNKKSGSISLPIARKEGSIIERCISSCGQMSITKYTCLKDFGTYSLVECKLETGRTHQIRVHMKAIGNPIVGDSLYGSPSSLIDRQALHSYKIDCIHPITKNYLHFVSNMPKDMENLL